MDKIIIDISVVICTFNRATLLDKTLSSFLQQENLDNISWELIVVDNNSTDNTKDVIEEKINVFNNKLIYVFEPIQGLNSARNRGVQESHGKIVAFTDDDVVISRNWLNTIKRGFQKYNVDGLGGKVLPIGDIKYPDWFIKDGLYRIGGVLVERDLGEMVKTLKQNELLPIGANMSFKKEVFYKFGMFNLEKTYIAKKKPIWVGTDTWFIQRIIRQGAKILYLPDMIIYHPIPTERFNKRYLKNWYFNLGRSFISNKGKLRGRRFLGIPLYLYKQIVLSFFKWLLCIVMYKKRIGFYFRLQFLQNLGSIYECLINRSLQ